MPLAHLPGPHQISIRRTLLALAIVVELAFAGVTWLWLGDEYRNPPGPFLGLVAVLGAMLLGTWLSETVRAHARELAVATIYLVSAHSLYLTWVNDLDPHYVMGLCMLVAGVVAVSVYAFRHVRGLLGYLVFFGVGASWVALAVDEPRTEPVFFALTVATLLVLTHVAVGALLRAVKRERESRRRHELVVAASPDPILHVRDGKVEGCPALHGMLGRRLRTYIGRPVTELLAERADDVADALESTVRTGSPQSVEGRLRADGDEPSLSVELRFTRMQGDEALVYARDRTEERRLERHLVQSERMASVGTLAFGIAHEINNPLSFVQNNTEWVIESLQERPDTAGRPTRKQLVEALDDVREGGNRIRQIVSDLLLSAQHDNERGHTELGPCVESAVKYAAGQLRHRAELDVDVDEIPPLAISQSQLVPVILNLLVNAAQALPGRSVELNRVAVRAFVREDGRAQVEVQDNGKGIPETELEHVLEPFFTTKPPGMGTGLGLYVTHQLVSSAGGEVAIDSTVGEGTTVRLLLPVAEPTGSEAAPPARCPPRLTGRRRHRGRVLVVDDEPAVARALARSLREHDVEIAGGGAEALERLSSESFDVVLCDLMMPGLGGMEVYQRVGDRTRERMIFVTGGAFDTETRRRIASVPVPLLRKPIDLEELRAAIAERMGEPRAALDDAS